MSLSKSIKNNPDAFIAVKLKGNLKKILQYKKAYKAIKSLELIDEDKYLNIHRDAINLDYVLHYLFYGVNDELNIKQRYTEPLFDLDYYMSGQDPLIDYVLNGFYSNENINEFDNGYIDTLEKPLSIQFLERYLKNTNFITDKRIVSSYIKIKEKLDFDERIIGVFTNDSLENISPCLYIRIYALFSKLSENGKYKFFLYGADSFSLMNFNKMLTLKVFDIVVVQRILPFLDTLLKKCQKHCIKLIYETDDDLLAVEKDSPSFEYVNRVMDEINNYIEASDIITVTTPQLAGKFNDKNVVIVPNYYVDTVYDIKKIKNGSILKLGYYGTLTHSKDLSLIKNVILKLKEKYDFDFEIVGGFNQSDNTEGGWFKAIEIPPDKSEFEKFMPWLSEISDWDMAIVPLKDSSFNKGKSELKYIELSVLGIPGVYSDMVVYNSVIKDGFNGLLASGEDEWVNKIESLILNVNLRKTISSNALNDVLTNYSMDNRVEMWDDIFNSL